MNGLRTSGSAHLVPEVFQQMQAFGISPNKRLYNELLASAAKMQVRATSNCHCLSSIEWRGL